MNNKEKIQQLRDIITTKMKPLVGDKCVLMDAPYHQNVGDVLIWGGD